MLDHATWYRARFDNRRAVVVCFPVAAVRPRNRSRNHRVADLVARRLDLARLAYEGKFQRSV
jgi:hypothetical protein